jgi:hypothetical protein
MFRTKHRISFLSSPALLLLSVTGTAPAVPPPSYTLPTLAPVVTSPQVQTWPKPIQPGGMTGSDPRTWSPYPPIPGADPRTWSPYPPIPGADPRTWSPYPLYPPPSLWVSPDRFYYPSPYYLPFRPINPGLIGSPLGLSRQ